MLNVQSNGHFVLPLCVNYLPFQMKTCLSQSQRSPTLGCFRISVGVRGVKYFRLCCVQTPTKTPAA